MFVHLYGLVAAQSAQEDKRILFQQNNKTLDLQAKSLQALLDLELENKCAFVCADSMQPHSHYWTFSIAPIFFSCFGLFTLEY